MRVVILILALTLTTDAIAQVPFVSTQSARKGKSLGQVVAACASESHAGTILPQTDCWHYVIYDWLETNVEADFDLTRTAFSWDSGVATRVERDSLLLEMSRFYADNYGSFPIQGASKWFVLDDGAGAGIEGAGVVGDYQWGGRAAKFYDLDMPNTGGTQGNPFYKDDAICRRSLVATAVDMMMQDKTGDQQRSDFLGGQASDWAYSYHICKGVLDATTQSQGFEGAFNIFLMDYWLANGPVDVNTNIDSRVINAVAEIYESANNDSTKTKALQVAKLFLFGSSDGSFADLDNDDAIWYRAGYIAEANGPETYYQGESLNSIVHAYAATYGEADWAFLEPLFNDMVDFHAYQWFVDPDEFSDGPSSYSARTGSAIFHGQNEYVWKFATIASLHDEKQFADIDLSFALDRPVHGDLTYDQWVTNGINDHNSKGVYTERVYCGGDIVSISRGAGNADDVVTISGDVTAGCKGGKNFTLVNTTDADGEYTIDSFTASGGNTEITMSNPVAGSQTGAVGEGWMSWTHDHWPYPMVYHPPDPDWFVELDTLVGVYETAFDDHPSVQSPFERPDSTHKKLFGDEFTSIRDSTSEGKHFGYFIEHVPREWDYNSWASGHLAAFWTDSTGTVILASKNKSGSGGSNETSRKWYLIDEWHMHHVWGVDTQSSDSSFSTAAWFDIDAIHVDTSHFNDSPGYIETDSVGFAIASGWDEANDSELGDEYLGWNLPDSGMVKTRYTFVDDGLQIDRTLTSDGSVQIEELWDAIPVHIRETDKQDVSTETTIEYRTDAGSWTTLSTSLVNADSVRLGRTFDGTKDYAYIHFNATSEIKAGPTTTLVYQGRNKVTPIHISQHSTTPGTAAAMPTNKTWQYTLTPTEATP